MPTVSKAARVTTKDDAVWRTCPTCKQFAPMASGALLCDSCAGTVKPAGSGVWSR